MDPNLYMEVLRRQAQVWTDLRTAFEETWNRSFSLRWTVETGISGEEVLADLAYGRD
jgi:hypothetical protein